MAEAHERPPDGPLTRVTVVSASMEPTIRAGESVWVRADLPCRAGDVVAIEHEGALLVHRIQGRIRLGGRTWYIHQGDASRRSGLAADDEIVGVVPGLWRRPQAPRNFLLLYLGALLRHLGLK